MTWEDVEDPEGRLKKGMLVKWKHSSGTAPEMEILSSVEEVK